MVTFFFPLSVRAWIKRKSCYSSTSMVLRLSKKKLFAASIKSINPCHPHDSDISPFKVHLNTPSTGFLFLFKCAQSSQSKLPQSAFNREGEFITQFRKKLKGSRSIWSTLILKQVQDPSEREHTTRLV